MRALVLAAVVFMASLSARAAPPGRWLADHLVVDAAGTIGFRSGWVSPGRDGFLTPLAGGEVNLGLEFDQRYGVLIGARALAGQTAGAELGVDALSYLEATGQAGLQLTLTDWLRLLGGLSVGRLMRCCADGGRSGMVSHDSLSLLTGGFLRIGVDFLPRSAFSGRRSALLLPAFSLWFRINIDGHPIDDTGTLPRASLAMSVSAGVRL